jgi:hypothetical protein
MVDIDSGLMGATVFPTSRAFVPPRIELKDGDLRWWRHYADRRHPYGREQSPRGMLDAFVGLDVPGDVLQFARRYGPLALCDHGKPATHNWTAEKPGCYPKDWQQGICREPLERWFYYVREARATLLIAAALHQVEGGPEDAWQVLLERYEGDDMTLAVAQRAKDSAAGRQSLVCEAVNSWLALANARFSLGWKDGKKPNLSLRGTTFTVLATQMMFAIARAHRLAICDACSHPYLREGRAPQSGRLNFCSKCSGTKMANTIRQQAYRKRKRLRDEQKEDSNGAQAR